VVETVGGQCLKDGWLKPHPVEVVLGGFAGVADGLNNLRDVTASTAKCVSKIEDTPRMENETRVAPAVSYARISRARTRKSCRRIDRLDELMLQQNPFQVAYYICNTN
jgi:hypothetical protein